MTGAGKTKCCFIRVDASSTIGHGHFMRCLTMAVALRDKGFSVHFLCRRLPGHFRDTLATQGMSCTLLDTPDKPGQCDDLAHSAWLGTSQEADAHVCLDQITAAIRADHCAGPTILVVDHYGLDYRWERLVDNHVNKIMVIDDLADRKHECNLLLDQNLYLDMAHRYRDKTPPGCKLLLGPAYALLRKNFSVLRKQVQPRRQLRRILIFFGGSDQMNCTGRALEALDAANIPVQVDVVLGSGQPYQRDIETVCKKKQFGCHIQTDRMAELMARADLALGAAGSASWERCCLGLPSVLVAIAANQIELAQCLDNAGACHYVGTESTVSAHTLKNAILSFFHNRSRLTDMSQKALQLVDGYGTERIVENLLGSGSTTDD